MLYPTATVRTYVRTCRVSIHLDSFLGLARSQLRRHGPSRSIAGEIGDRNENAANPGSAAPEPDSADFRLAEDTTTWSSLAIARDNVQQSNPSQQPTNVNNNLTEPKIQRNSSVESLADYEGECRFVCICVMCVRVSFRDETEVETARNDEKSSSTALQRR